MNRITHLLPLFLVAVLTFTSCEKDKAVSSTPTESSANENYSVKADIEGSTFDFSDLQQHGIFSYIQQFPEVDSVHLSQYAFFDNKLMNLSGGKFRFMIGVRGLKYKTSSYQSTSTLFNNSIASLNPEYYQEGSEIPSYEIMLVDQNFEMWSTRFAPQSGSELNITTNTVGHPKPASPVNRTIAGTFSCTVYREANPSESITITNGSFKIYLPKSQF